MGLRVSDDEVLAGMISNYPSFFPNGVLASKEQFENAVRQNGHTMDEEVEAMRNQLLMKKLQDVALGGIIVTPKEVENELIRKYERAKVVYIAFPPGKFRSEVKPSEEDIKAYFDTHRNEFMRPEKRTFQVVIIDQDKVEASMAVSDAQLRAAYSSNMDSFRSPERVHVRHILVDTTKKSDAEKKQLLSKAQDLEKQVKAGADFGALAKQYSEDPGSKDKGGEYWVVRGQMVKPFEDASFSLKPGDSTIVTTEYGYHVLQVMAKENARVKPFDEVKASLAAELKKQGVTEKMQALGDQVRAELAKNPEGAADVTKRLDLQLVTVPNGSPNEPIPTLGQSPEVDQALATLQPNQVSQVLTLPSNRLAVAVLNMRTPSRQAELDEVHDKVRETLITRKVELVATAHANEAAEKLKAGEDIEKVAKAAKLEVTSPPEFGHTDAIEGLGTAAYLEEAFTKPVGTILGPMVIQARNIVAKVVEKKPADLSRLAAEHDMLVANLRHNKAQSRDDLLRDSILAKLTAEGKVKINRDAIKKFTASFRSR
jgi:peptidyl-prolyl cis-trans isomerase D